MSKWLASGELYDRIKNLDEKERLFELYGLSCFCQLAFLSCDFEPSPAWKDCLVLTQHGRDYLKQIHQAGVEASEAHETFVLFQLFYHHRCL